MFTQNSLILHVHRMFNLMVCSKKEANQGIKGGRQKAAAPYARRSTDGG